VVGNEIVASMMRTAPNGEFRANIHRGGVGTIVKLPSTYARTALQAARVLGLDIAGIDIIASRRGPLILEANSSPGFEGLERATHINLASAIIDHMAQSTGRKPKRRGRAAEAFLPE
jgi:ribosomal protein S6--L-glutamate ligase